MTDAAVEDCLTCWRKTDDFLRMADKTNSEVVGGIVANHFWFQADQYEDRVLCTGCWGKIEDFHKFYCEVKQLWNHEEDLPKKPVIKTEGEDGHQQELIACELVKVEVEDSRDDDYQVPDESETTEDSDEESKVPIAKRSRSAKAKPRAKTKAPKGEKKPRKKRQVNTQPKPPPKRLNRSMDEFPFKCDICDPVRMFKDKEALLLHNMVSHAEESDKKFQCDLCEKAFSSEWQLSGHKNWHQKELLNIYCDKCDKHFDSVRTLNNHIKAHHTENTTDFSPPIFVPTMDTVESDFLPPTESMENPQDPPQVASVPAPHKLTPEERAERDALIKKFCTLICDRCGFAGEGYYQLEKHYETEHNISGYATCCSKKFYKKRQLYEHCQRHVNPDIFRCEPCKKSFVEKDALMLHNKRVHLPDSEKPFKCDICGLAFFKEYLLKTHMKYHLSKEQKLYNCEECDISFGAATYLRTHQQRVHGVASRLVCDICAKGFTHRFRLEAHRLSHSKEGAASLKKQCENCKKWLKNVKTYRTHTARCFAGNNPVRCDLCDKEVLNLPALANHKRLHHTERPVFPCSYCGKQFKRAIRQREHEANHRGEVLYNCEFCPYSCNSNSNMYSHKKAAHSELWAAKIAEKYYKR